MKLLLLAIVLIPMLIFVAWHFCIGFARGWRNTQLLSPEDHDDLIHYIYGRLDGSLSDDAPIFRPRMRIID